MHLFVILAKFLRPRGVRVVTGQRLPRLVGTDHDALFRFQRGFGNLRVLEIEKFKSIQVAPPLMEPVTGTVHREYLDCVFFGKAFNLTRKVKAFQDNYDAGGVHLSHDAPRQRTAPGPLHRLLLRLINTLGGSTIAAYFRFQSLYEYEFATDSL